MGALFNPSPWALQPLGGLYARPTVPKVPRTVDEELLLTAAFRVALRVSPGLKGHRAVAFKHYRPKISEAKHL